MNAGGLIAMSEHKIIKSMIRRRLIPYWIQLLGSGNRCFASLVFRWRSALVERIVNDASCPASLKPVQVSQIDRKGLGLARDFVLRSAARV